MLNFIFFVSFFLNVLLLFGFVFKEIFVNKDLEDIAYRLRDIQEYLCGEKQYSNFQCIEMIDCLEDKIVETRWDFTYDREELKKQKECLESYLEREK